MKKNKPAPAFHGYDVFSLQRDEQFPETLPTHIRVIDENRLVPVDFDLMSLFAASGPAYIHLRKAGTGLTRATAELFYATALDALNGRRKVSTVARWISTFSLFLRMIRAQTTSDICTLNLAMFLWATSGWGPSQEKLLRSLLKFWIKRRYPGIAADLKTYIKTSKSPKPATTTEIQAQKDWERPFTIARVRQILSSIESLYIEHKFDPQDNLLWRLIVTEALRPSQMRLLQVGDVRQVEEGGWAGVELRVPLVKLHGSPSRSHMVATMVTESVARALHDHLVYLKGIYGCDLPPSQPLLSVQRHGGLKVLPKGIGISPLIKRTRALIAKNTEDLVDADLFCRRFKHTKLTQLAILGAPLEVLARSAFQTTLGSVKYYVNFNEEALADYEAKMGPRHDALESAFRGEVVKLGTQTVGSSSNLVLDESMTKSVGACASVPCGVLAPVGCYVCPRFEAFEDGPHDLVLNSLEEDRSRAEQSGLPIETIMRDDNLIAAVRQVIALVEVRRGVP